MLVRVGLFDRELVHLEDRDCWLRLLATARFGVLEEPLMSGRLDVDVPDPDRRRWPYEEALDAVRLWQLMATHPTEYPPEAVALYAVERWRPLLAVGRLAEADGLVREARRHYLRAWWLGGGTWPLVRAVVSYLPTPVRGGLAAIRARPPTGPPRVNRRLARGEGHLRHDEAEVRAGPECDALGGAVDDDLLEQLEPRLLLVEELGRLGVERLALPGIEGVARLLHQLVEAVAGLASRPVLAAEPGRMQDAPEASVGVEQRRLRLMRSRPSGGIARSLSMRWRAPISIISTLARMPTFAHMSAMASSSCLSLTMVPMPAWSVTSIPPGEPRLGQERARPRGVVRIRLERGVVAEVGVREPAASGLPMPAKRFRMIAGTSSA